MLHLDLFSGIGGFAYAADLVWPGIEHVFCDNDPFCRQVLKKHWPESEIYDDIRNISAWDRERPVILTGGFPCQPFSSAGRRRGTEDDRYLWQEMLRVIQLAEPEWVIAENVRGLLTLDNGVVFEQVCLDLEASGYEVQPFIIPAVAVNAPHRRDRVWFVANHSGDRRLGGSAAAQVEKGHEPQSLQAWKLARGLERPYSDVADAGRLRGQQGRSTGLRPSRQEPEQSDCISADELGGAATDDPGTGLERRCQPGSGQYRQPDRIRQLERSSWNEDWIEVAAEFCRVDDGLPVELDGFELSKSQHRKQQLKAYGNAIVPQVALEIMQGMAQANVQAAQKAA